MRTLRRNGQTFYYARFIKRESMRDENGNLTGESSIVYGKPIKSVGNISAAKGTTHTREFGESLDYDKVIVISGINSAIDEFSVLWIDTAPMLTEDGTTNTPWDFVVKKIAKSLNYTAIAVSKVSVSK